TAPAKRAASDGPPASRARPLNQRVLQADRNALISGKWYRGVLLVAIAVFLGLVSFTQRHLNVSREKLGLTRVAPLENAPPLLAFTTVALGGFRGLIA